MEIKNLKTVKNNSNVIERKVCNLLSLEDVTISKALELSIENLGLNVSIEEITLDFVPYFLYLDALKEHTFLKEAVYSNYGLILDHIEKTTEILDNHKEHKATELTSFKEWLGISDKFHNALIS